MLTKSSTEDANKKHQEGCMLHRYSGDPLEYGDIELDVRGGATCYFYLQENNDGYVFELKPDIELNTISKIDVIKNGTVVQTIDTTAMSQPVYKDQEFFTTIDANFDGYKDLSLVLWSGATGNVGHGFWIFDPKNNIFSFDEKLSSLTSPVFDATEKKIFSHANGGMTGCIYGNSWYTYDVDGALRIREQEIQDYDSKKNIFVRTTTLYTDGSIVEETTLETTCLE